MTPTEVLNQYIEQLLDIDGVRTPELLEYTTKLRIIADSDDEDAKIAVMKILIQTSLQKATTSQIDLSSISSRAPEKSLSSRQDRAEKIYRAIRNEYPRYKQFAIRGVIYGAILLAIFSVISLFYFSEENYSKLINESLSNSETNILKFLRLDYVFICLMSFRFLDFLIIAIVSFIAFSREQTEGVRKLFRKFGVEALIIFTLIIYILEALGMFASSLLNVTFTIYIAGILSFLGWCAVASLIILYLFSRANVGDEAKLYFTTFGIELLINTVRLYILFVVLYIPIFIGAVFYVSSQGKNFDKSWSNLPYEVAGFWGWWIPAILASINLAMSLGIFLGWKAPVTGLKLSFDSREMTSEEKDFMIGFYRKLVESGRPDEKVFRSWNIIESSGVFAFTYGENIFISRGAFQERYFNALVAHEIGHLHQRDGLVLQALHSFTYPLFNHLLFNPTTIQRGVIEQEKDFNKPNSLLSGIISSMTITFFTLIFGGWSVQSLARFWSKFYIERDYIADDYACELGFAGELLNYLDSYKDFDTALPLFNRWRGYTRVRIERIRTKIEMSY